jgi:hypothetical protein
MRPCLLLRILPFLAVLLFAAGAAGAADAPPLERMRDGVRLIALTPETGTRFDVTILPPDAGLARLAAALDLIREKSPASAATIDRLAGAGPATLVYFPNNFRDRSRLNSQTVALFLPDFLKSRGLGADGQEFVVVVNQFGVKWPAGELAAVIVHELVGHGMQHLAGRIATGRPLDLECEASLYQEQAYQDFQVAKKARTVVMFRRQMEYHYCSDFRAYMAKRLPEGLALWDSINPDVATLLEMFSGYRGIQAALKPSEPPRSAKIR